MEYRLRLAAAILFGLLANTWAQFIDEMQEYEQNCLAEDAYRCADQGCISQLNVCDGLLDCADGSDEDFCASANGTKVVLKCNEVYQFSCLDGGGCVHLNNICSGTPGCADASDTRNCTSLTQIVDHYYFGKTRPGPLNPELDCSLFSCDGGTKCISYMWLCDGHHDCEDKTDENDPRLCRIVKQGRNDTFLDGKNCIENSFGVVRHACEDHSFCLRPEWLCDGVKDCRDGSDERPDHCDTWSTMCVSHKCGANSSCVPAPGGPYCRCLENYKYYNNRTGACENKDECLDVHPVCSHKCYDYPTSGYRCECEDGYFSDFSKYQCFASGEAGKLFYTTGHEIKYVNIRTGNSILAVADTKQAHDVVFDGTYIYWLETLDGHQAIYRAELNNVNKTKMVIISVGLEEPGALALDWAARRVYVTDAARGALAACEPDGARCAVLRVTPLPPRHPAHLALHVPRGEMYWTDWHGKPVIMHANMDGSNSSIFIDGLESNPTGLTLDIPNDRIYYVDKHIYVAKMSGGKSYRLLDEEQSRPYSLGVFEGSVYWGAWGAGGLHSCDKVHPPPERRRLLLQTHTPVFGIHIYHPLLQRPMKNPCSQRHCPDMCLLSGATGASCVCLEGREPLDNNTCIDSNNVVSQYLIVGGGNKFIRFRYNLLGNLDTNATTFNIGRVQAMAFDNYKQILYLYDGQHKTINYISLINFGSGKTQTLEYTGLVNVIDMEYDYVSDSLYVLDEARRLIEVISLRTKARGLIYRFEYSEIPVSFCVMPDYGRLMVALVERERHNEIHVDVMGLNGKERRNVLETGFRGPRVGLRYSRHADAVFISDEAGGTIDYIHPTGTGREEFRTLSTSVRSLAVTDIFVFWTDRRTPRLYWSNRHETQSRVHRIEMGYFANHSQLYLQPTAPPVDIDNPLMQNPCFLTHPCSHICVQIPHPSTQQASIERYMGYECLCPVGLVLKNNKCELMPKCSSEEIYCHHDGDCVKGKRCDGLKQCSDGEDERHCEEMPKGDKTPTAPTRACLTEETLCNGVCILKNISCQGSIVERNCSAEEFECKGVPVCLPHWMRCNKVNNCPDHSDEEDCDSFECMDFEFRCASGSCTVAAWRCDGEEDCMDGSDELNCVNKTCPQGYFPCGGDGDCVDINKRCDDVPDCPGGSDEDDCDGDIIPEIESEHKECESNELTCLFNTSICLPVSARCNSRVECPDASDEMNCYSGCSQDMFKCKEELTCIPRKKMCDGVADCFDASDEITNLCRGRRRVPAPPGGHVPVPTSQSSSTVYIDRYNNPSDVRPPGGHVVYPNRTGLMIYRHDLCLDGYRCENGQCLPYSAVCDERADCYDGTDEGPNCASSCDNTWCGTAKCARTPAGGACWCGRGWRYDNRSASCRDIDECAEGYCDQNCVNTPGNFFCFCFTSDYALRRDMRTCKVTKGKMAIMFLTGNTVRSVSSEGEIVNVYSDPETEFNDIDYDIRKKILYLTSRTDKKLVQVTLDNTEKRVVTNVGEPTLVAVDWITDNIYFVDASSSKHRLRVCNINRQRCAKMQRFPDGSEVTALAVDPARGRLFYCVSSPLESVVWSSPLAGAGAGAGAEVAGAALDLLSVGNCSGLALDSYRAVLYVADHQRHHILLINYTGEVLKVLKDNPHISAPYHLGLYDEEVYFLQTDGGGLSRCSVRGELHCSAYLLRSQDARAFFLHHRSLQRHDVSARCRQDTCRHVCVPGPGPEAGPEERCLCEAGYLARTDTGRDCTELPYDELPLFDGVTRRHYDRVYSWIFGLVGMSAIVLAGCGYYCWVKSRRTAGGAWGRIVFSRLGHNQRDPTVAIEPEILDGPSSEYVNPINQYVRDMWHRTENRYRTSFRGPLKSGIAPLKEQDCVSNFTGSTSSGTISQGVPAKIN